MFRLYLETGSMTRVTERAEQLAIRSKRRVLSDGRILGDKPMRRGQIHYLLTNPIYCGKIRHKTRVYDGQHEAIVDEATWNAVQSQLSRAGFEKTTSGASSAWLKGKLRDEAGDRLTPTHTQKGRRRFAYYVSKRLIIGGQDRSGWRLPAGELEAAVCNTVRGHLLHAADRGVAVRHATADQILDLKQRLARLVEDIVTDPAGLSELIAEGEIAPGRMRLQLSKGVLAEHLGVGASLFDPDLLTLEAPFSHRKRGVETKLITGAGPASPDEKLQRLLARSHAWVDALKAGKTLKELAKAEGVTDAFIRSRLDAAFLSPKIQQAIADGTQPADLCCETLIRAKLPACWTQQERMLGFA